MPAHPTTDGLKVLVLLDALRGPRLTPAALCRAAGISRAGLDDLATRVPIAALARMLDEAERRSGDRLIGLHAGQRANPRGVLSYLAMSSPHLGDGLRYLARFSSLVIDRIDIDLDIRRSAAVLTVDRDGHVLGRHRHLIDYLLMSAVRSLRRAVGGRLRLLGVDVRHAGARDCAAMSEAFGCPVHVGQPDNRLLFPPSLLRTPTAMANPLIAAQLERFAAGLDARLHAPAPIRGQVADATRTLLAAGVRADRHRVARRLHVSHRTLQRRLAEEGTTFKAVRDEVVRDVVEALMSNPELSVEAIALSVGFGDAAAFSRAFKRWAGRSPRQHRRANA